jgi:hypothetical protein
VVGKIDRVPDITGGRPCKLEVHATDVRARHTEYREVVRQLQRMLAKLLEQAPRSPKRAEGVQPVGPGRGRAVSVEWM